jgi:hypothetical protein
MSNHHIINHHYNKCGKKAVTIIMMINNMMITHKAIIKIIKIKEEENKMKINQKKNIIMVRILILKILTFQPYKMISEQEATKEGLLEGT